MVRRHQRRIGVFLDLLAGYTRQMVAGIARYASERGDWSLVVARDDDHTVILGGFGEEDLQSLDGIIAGKTWLKFTSACPVIYTSTPWGQCHGPVVCQDDVAIGRVGATHLLSLGLSNYGFVGMRKVPWSEQRQEGFETKLREHGQTSLKLLFGGWLEAQRGIDEIVNWLRSLPLPCAVFCSDDRVAVNVVAAARMLNLHVPEQLAILGVNDDDICCASVTPALSSVPLPGDAIGYESARRLDRMMSNPGARLEPIVTLPPGKVVQRGSTEVLGYNDLIVCEAMRLIRSRSAMEAVVVDQIASELGMHRQQLNRSFAKHVGRSPKEEIDRVRAERLRSMLVDSDQPIKQIAYNMGFASPSQLIRFCRRTFGVTPLELREQAVK